MPLLGELLSTGAVHRPVAGVRTVPGVGAYLPRPAPLVWLICCASRVGPMDSQGTSEGIPRTRTNIAFAQLKPCRRRRCQAPRVRSLVQASWGTTSATQRGPSYALCRPPSGQGPCGGSPGKHNLFAGSDQRWRSPELSLTARTGMARQLAHFRPIPQNRPAFGQNWSEFGKMCPEHGQTRAAPPRRRPTPARVGPNLARVRPKLRHPTRRADSSPPVEQRSSYGGG